MYRTQDMAKNNIPKIYQRQTKDMSKMYVRYIKDLPEICQRCTKDTVVAKKLA
jgi:hypothetical protein